ncbi:hypothetical protein TCAL_16098 [Tigriopus californicus]|uniref:Uncharacterized protein n=1 Tax=Tigriopus californicus TaxID=6832 RepID=A0A553PQ15_TIGCA|nr:hypothetical protein TCAL_16098 [Tigriopus californicus]
MAVLPVLPVLPSYPDRFLSMGRESKAEIQVETRRSARKWCFFIYDRCYQSMKESRYLSIEQARLVDRRLVGANTV